MDMSLDNRDPNNLNDHLKVSFEDIFGEPEGAHSADCVWKLAFKCFNLWLGLCYKLSTLCCGICIAAEWACEFAGVAFYHIWFITPCLHMFQINCSVFKRMNETCCACILEPCCYACGKLFHMFEKN